VDLVWRLALFFAFLSVLMAWYGVNFVLGAGLHSYGFGTGGFPAVFVFVGLEVVFVLLAFLRKGTGKSQPQVLRSVPQSEGGIRPDTDGGVSERHADGAGTARLVAWVSVSRCSGRFDRGWHPFA
jgi:hypothetical protein